MTIDIGKTEAEHTLWAEKLYHAADTDFDLGADGVVSRDGLALGKLTRGADALTPDVAIFIDEAVDADIREKIHRRLGHFIERKIAMHFAPLLALRDDETLKTPEHANGAYLAKRLVEALGVVPRGFLRRTIKEMDQDARTPLRKCGVRFGQYMIYLPLLLKPAPTQLRLVLWAVFEGFADFPIVPSAGLVTIPALKDMPSGYHWRAGYQAMTVFGIVFLVGYGAMRVRAVLYSDYRNELEGAPVSVFKILAILVGVTWLNPHVYLDTVVLIGAVSTQFDGAGARFACWICASFASFSLFFTFWFGAKLVAPMFGRARFLRILDAGIAVFMFCLATALLLTISY